MAAWQKSTTFLKFKDCLLQKNVFLLSEKNMNFKYIELMYPFEHVGFLHVYKNVRGTRSFFFIRKNRK